MIQLTSYIVLCISTSQNALQRRVSIIIAILQMRKQAEREGYPAGEWQRQEQNPCFQSHNPACYSRDPTPTDQPMHFGVLLLFVLLKISSYTYRLPRLLSKAAAFQRLFTKVVQILQNVKVVASFLHSPNFNAKAL